MKVFILSLLLVFVVSVGFISESPPDFHKDYTISCYNVVSDVPDVPVLNADVPVCPEVLTVIYEFSACETTINGSETKNELSSCATAYDKYWLADVMTDASEWYFEYSWSWNV